jgi:flagellar motor switch protein FliN/FliY
MTDQNDVPVSENVDDMWAAAMSESQANSEAAAAAPEASAQAGSEVFPPLNKASVFDGSSRELEMIRDIPVTLSVELGRKRLPIKQLLEMAQGSVIDLDGVAGDPMSIFINNHLVASGEVVVVGDKYGIRITEIITPSERIQKLSKQ